MIVLPPNLASLSRLASKQPGRYATRAVRLQQTADGYQAMATDGRVLAIINGPSPVVDLPTQAQEMESPSSESLIPATAWSRILKSARKEEAIVLIGEQGTAFAIGNSWEVTPNEEGRFPEVDCLVNRQCVSLVKIPVNAKQLARLLLIAAEFADADSETDRVTLHYGGKDRPLLVTVNNSSGQRFQAAIAPVA